MHFSEIIKLQFRKKSHTLHYILVLFRNIVAQLSLKNAWLPLIFYINSPCKDLLFPHSHKHHKNTSLLVGIVLNKTVQGHPVIRGVGYSLETPKRLNIMMTLTPSIRVSP